MDVETRAHVDAVAAQQDGQEPQRDESARTADTNGSPFAAESGFAPDAAAVPPEDGVVPSEAEPDPAPEQDLDRSPATDPLDRGGTGQPVGADNIREGRVDGVMVPPGSTQGQGQGG